MRTPAFAGLKGVMRPVIQPEDMSSLVGDALPVDVLRPSSPCRCLLGEADGALYMAFMGTKQRRDLVTNAQVLQEAIWPEDLVSDTQNASQVALHSTPGICDGLIGPTRAHTHSHTTPEPSVAHLAGSHVRGTFPPQYSAMMTA